MNYLAREGAEVERILENSVTSEAHVGRAFTRPRLRPLIQEDHLGMVNGVGLHANTRNRLKTKSLLILSKLIRIEVPGCRHNRSVSRDPRVEPHRGKRNVSPVAQHTVKSQLTTVSRVRIAANTKLGK